MYFHYEIFIHKKCLQNENDKLQKSLSRPSITDTRAHYWAGARRLKSPALEYVTQQDCRSCLHLLVKVSNKFDYQSKPRLQSHSIT
jgi:hypothetical protein